MRTRRSQSSSDLVPPAVFAATNATLASRGHQSVLLHEAIQELDIQKDDVVVDATLGGAGHARAIADKLGPKGIFIGMDLDSEAIERAREALTHEKAEIHLITANFRTLSSELDRTNISRITKALFDLGWSGYQLAAGRGFSFLKDEPLLMTYAKDPPAGALTAAEIVNTWEEESIADIIFGWGEERYSRRIARAIVERRARKQFKTSHDLGEVIRAAVPPTYRHRRVHPATKTFQALRISVNDELGALKEAIESAWKHLTPQGRIAVITFHSIEDRIVKQQFVAYEQSGEGKRITRKPITPTSEEIASNPRARSAKLRVLEKN